jgi:hypothetical protein
MEEHGWLHARLFHSPGKDRRPGGPYSRPGGVAELSRPSVAPSSDILYLYANLHLLQRGIVRAVGSIVRKKKSNTKGKYST